MNKYKCPHCDKEFSTKNGLGYHITQMHKDINQKYEYLCRCGAIIQSYNKTMVKCKCGYNAFKRKQLCSVCGEYKHGTVKDVFTCKDCSNDARAKTMSLLKIDRSNCNNKGGWDIPKSVTSGKSEDVAQAIKCTYFTNRPLAERYIAEAQTYDDVIRIRNEYEKGKRKNQTFWVAVYG